MSITYKVLPLENFILEVWDGVITIDDVCDHWSRMLQDKDCITVRRTLADLRTATLRFSDGELHTAIQEVALPNLRGGEWTSAIVVHHPQQLQVASRYQGQAMSFSDDAIFSSVEEARRWLLRQQPLRR